MKKTHSKISLTKDDIYAPNSIPGAVPSSESSLQEIIVKDPQHFDAVFALGFTQLRASKFDEAIKSFQRVIEINTNSAEARYNLGISLLAAGRTQSAIREFRKAVLQKKDFALGFYNLGRALESIKDFKSAIQNYKKSLNINPKQSRVLVSLAELVQEKEKLELLKKAYELDSNQDYLRDVLAKKMVNEAFINFDKEHFSQGFVTLADAYKQYAKSFSSNQIIVEKIRKKARELQALGAKGSALKKYWQSFLSDQSGQTSYLYSMLNTCLFTFGLIPELWSAESEIDSNLNYWKESAENTDIVPYAKYRYGLLLFFKANFEQARKELEIARDSLPRSKHEGIKIEEIISLLKEVISLHRAHGEKVDPDNSSEDEWDTYGFEDAFQIKAWRSVGLKPELAAEWKACGFSAKQAASWVKEKIAPKTASLWKKAGIDNPKEVRRWLRADITVDQATPWRLVFEKSDFQSPQMPIQCIQAGFSEPENALRWMKLFTFPSEAMRWIDLGFLPQDAAVFLRQGVSDPYEAKKQKDKDEL